MHARSLMGVLPIAIAGALSLSIGIAAARIAKAPRAHKIHKVHVADKRYCSAQPRYIWRYYGGPKNGMWRTRVEPDCA
jgi:hypothetical protein